jgi:diguanylate cyclase (GGDEF)-like protein/PAS domain S-box-containing protein
MDVPSTNTSLFNTIIDNIEDGVYFVDTTRRIQLWNGAANNITGYSGEDMIGHYCQDNLLNHVDQDGKPLCQVGCPLYATMNDGQSRQADVLLRHKSGHRLPVQVQTHPVYRDGEIVGALEIFARRNNARYDDRLVASLADKAMKDPLTGLANHAFLESFIEYKLSEQRRFHSAFSVLVADVDNFTEFNHYYNRVVGDVVLQSMAESFRNNFFEPNKVGVWSNAMFAGVFAANTPAEIYSAVEKFRVLAARSAVYHQDNYLALTASVGMTLSQPTDTVQTIVARAEELMEKSKQHGKNCCTVDIPPP